MERSEVSETEYLNVIKDAHKVTFWVLDTHGMTGKPLADETERQEALQELDRVSQLLRSYR